MDPKAKEQIEKRLKEGWIHSWMMIEVLAVTEEAARSALEKHIQGMEREKKTMMVKKEFKDIRKIENPNVPPAYSYLVELELLTEDFDTLVYLAMNYAPSSIEILSPEKIRMDAGEAQGIINSIADMMHKFARSGVGGVVIRS